MESFTASGNARPSYTTLAQGISVKGKYRTTSSRALVCKYSRPVVPQVANSYYNLQQPHYVVYASGTVNGNTPQKHAFEARKATADSVIFIELATVSAPWNFENRPRYSRMDQVKFVEDSL